MTMLMLYHAIILVYIYIYIYIAVRSTIMTSLWQPSALTPVAPRRRRSASRPCRPSASCDGAGSRPGVAHPMASSWHGRS